MKQLLTISESGTIVKNILASIYGYHAWANNDLVDKLKQVDPVSHAAVLETALRLVSHYHVVARIFRGHLTGAPHGYSADNVTVTPKLEVLAAQLREIDKWYQGYLADTTETQLAEPIAFVFTDGDKGMMTRAEMITHVTLHGGYHRGEIGRLLWGLDIAPPWDTYAVFLHQSQPERREQRSMLLA